MRKFLYYCQDFEKYGNLQEWKIKIEDKEIIFQAKRDNLNCWEVSVNSLKPIDIKLSFDNYYDYKPLHQELYPKRDFSKNEYWTFLEVKSEIERIISNLAKVF